MIQSPSDTLGNPIPLLAQSRLQHWRLTAPPGLSITLAVSDTSIRYTGVLDMSGATSWAEIDVVDAVALNRSVPGGTQMSDAFDGMLLKLTDDLLESSA